jgi:dATP pyrophosphohydrolase
MPKTAIRVIDVYPYRRLPDSQFEFLLLRRANGQLFEGQWRMVGGKIKTGEAASQAALRETREELGEEPLVFWALPSVNMFYDWRHDTVNIVPAFAAELGADPILNQEHDNFEWLDVDAAACRLAWPEQQRLLRLTSEILTTGGPIEELIVDLR